MIKLKKVRRDYEPKGSQRLTFTLSNNGMKHWANADEETIDNAIYMLQDCENDIAKMKEEIRSISRKP